MKLIKRILRWIITLPQMILLVAGGVKIKNIADYDQYTSFFRHFPFGRISKDGIATFRFSGKKVRMTSGDLNPVDTLAGIFRMKEYDSISDINGNDVVDIGAAIGDTAVYFALRGAKKVYGYEINERYYNLAQKNIELNDLKNIISVELCGISATDKPLDSALPMLGAVVPERDRNATNGIKMKTLDEVARLHDIDGGILKIDTEGFEYEILNGAAPETLKLFSQIFLEYHYGVQNLPEKLESAGFTVEARKASEIRVETNPDGYKNMDVGYILAKRK